MTGVFGTGSNSHCAENIDWYDFLESTDTILVGIPRFLELWAISPPTYGSLSGTLVTSLVLLQIPIDEVGTTVPQLSYPVNNDPHSGTMRESVAALQSNVIGWNSCKFPLLTGSVSLTTQQVSNQHHCLKVKDRYTILFWASTGKDETGFVVGFHFHFVEPRSVYNVSKKW